MLDSSVFVVDEDFTIDVFEEPSDKDEESELIIDETKEAVETTCPLGLKCECGCNITKIAKSVPICVTEHAKAERVIRKEQAIQKIKQKLKRQEDMKPDIEKVRKSVIDGTVKKRKGFLNCTACSYNTTRYNLFIVHLDAHLNYKKHFICDTCDYVALRKNQLSLHKVKCNSRRSFSCPHCTFATLKHFYLQKHLKRHYNNRQCDLCSFETNNEIEMRQHVKKTHRLNYKCEDCNFKTSVKRELERHTKKHIVEQKEVVMRRTLIKCDLCDYESFYKRNVLQHRVSHLESV